MPSTNSIHQVVRTDVVESVQMFRSRSISPAGTSESTSIRGPVAAGNGTGGAHRVNDFVVLAGITSVWNQSLDRPVFDAECWTSRGSVGTLRRRGTVIDRVSRRGHDPIFLEIKLSSQWEGRDQSAKMIQDLDAGWWIWIG
jgi:hypothetical protein